ncbi:hypothetical protein B0H14DRAFT_2562450 [Mycena olivaceomarginata]|nr:hypothetical protein B0H14DRAFT_2562450 [Mycena olivaceomarginata]
MPPTMPDNLNVLNGTYCLSDETRVFQYGSNEVRIYVLCILVTFLGVAVFRLMVHILWHPYNSASWRTGATTLIKASCLSSIIQRASQTSDICTTPIAAPPRLLFIYVFVIFAVSIILACIQYHSFESFQPNAIFSIHTLDELAAFKAVDLGHIKDSPASEMY